VIDHVFVLTDDLEASRRFYCDLLGLEQCERPSFPFAGYWLGSDGRVFVHLGDRSEFRGALAALGLEEGTGPVDHVAIRVEALDELAARLAAAGVEAVANEVPGVSRQLFVTDPNGVRIEVNVPVEQSSS
jgi:catechol 2,3-dioxygenase-like lactoylglutathione lyase family enzyme